MILQRQTVILTSTSCLCQRCQRAPGWNANSQMPMSQVEEQINCDWLEERKASASVPRWLVSDQTLLSMSVFIWHEKLPQWLKGKLGIHNVVKALYHVIVGPNDDPSQSFQAMCPLFVICSNR